LHLPYIGLWELDWGKRMKETERFAEVFEAELRRMLRGEKKRGIEKLSSVPVFRERVRIMAQVFGRIGGDGMVNYSAECLKCERKFSGISPSLPSKVLVWLLFHLKCPVCRGKMIPFELVELKKVESIVVVRASNKDGIFKAVLRDGEFRILKETDDFMFG